MPNVKEGDFCNFGARSATTELLRLAKLIVWDEAPMAHRWMLEALIDRSLRDIMNREPDKPLGGKVIVLAGDYRQNLLVIHRNRAQIVHATHPHSDLWQHFNVMKLEENLRLRTADERSREYSEWLLRVGDGEAPSAPSEFPEDFISIPTHLSQSSNLDELIRDIYLDVATNIHDGAWVASRSILAPTNSCVSDINDKVLESVPGFEETYYSSDELVLDDGSGDGIDVPVEYLNTLTAGGLPPHDLRLKKGVPIMLLRNLNLAEGLCNGIRLIVKEVINNRLLKAFIPGIKPRGYDSSHFQDGTIGCK